MRPEPYNTEDESTTMTEVSRAVERLNTIMDGVMENTNGILDALWELHDRIDSLGALIGE